jgi:hypothetical protein
MTLFLAFFLALSSQEILEAETILLKNGQAISGQIVSQSRTDVQINVNGQIITIQKDQIRRIQYANDPAAAEAERRRQEEAERMRLEAVREAQRQEAERRAREQNAERLKRESEARAEKDKQQARLDAEAAEREARYKRRYFTAGLGMPGGFYSSSVLEQYSQHTEMVMRKGGTSPGVVFNSGLHDRGIKGWNASASFVQNRFSLSADFERFKSKPKAVFERATTSGTGISVHRDDLWIYLQRKETNGAIGYSFFRREAMDMRIQALFRDEVMTAKIESLGPGVSPNNPNLYNASYDDDVRHRVYGPGLGFVFLYKPGKLEVSGNFKIYRLHGPWGLNYQRGEIFSDRISVFLIDTEGVLRKKTMVFEPGIGYEFMPGWTLRARGRFEQASYSVHHAILARFIPGAETPSGTVLFILQDFLYNGPSYTDRLNQHDGLQWIQLGVEKRFDF